MIEPLTHHNSCSFWKQFFLRTANFGKYIWGGKWEKNLWGFCWATSWHRPSLAVWSWEISLICSASEVPLVLSSLNLSCFTSSYFPHIKFISALAHKLLLEFFFRLNFLIKKKQNSLFITSWWSLGAFAGYMVLFELPLLWTLILNL